MTSTLVLCQNMSCYLFCGSPGTGSFILLELPPEEKIPPPSDSLRQFNLQKMNEFQFNRQSLYYSEINVVKVLTALFIHLNTLHLL